MYAYNKDPGMHTGEARVCMWMCVVCMYVYLCGVHVYGVCMCV